MFTKLHKVEFLSLTAVEVSVFLGGMLFVRRRKIALSIMDAAIFNWFVDSNILFGE